MTGNRNQTPELAYPSCNRCQHDFFLTFTPGVTFGICFDSGVDSARWTKESHTTEGWKHKAHHLEHGSFQVLNREEMIFLAIPSKALLAVVQIHTCYGKSSKKIICRSKASRVLGCGTWSWSLFQSPPLPYRCFIWPSMKASLRPVPTDFELQRWRSLQLGGVAKLGSLR